MRRSFEKKRRRRRKKKKKKEKNSRIVIIVRIDNAVGMEAPRSEVAVV